MSALTPGLVIAAPRSGAGKTTVMLGLLRCLADDGIAVQPYKCGPDYIDPAFHRAAAGRASFNLDSWAMAPGLLRAELARGGEIALAEGSMGLFDGVAVAGEQGTGATADIAALTGWPVVIVLDVSGQAQTAGALAAGLARFRPDVRIAGAILNRVASPRHERLCRLGLEAAGVRVLGALPRRGDLALPERHLGLVQAAEHPDLEPALVAYAAFLRDHLDIGALRALADRGAPAWGDSGPLPPPPGPLPPPPGQRIAIARDEAFSFAYPHLLDAWARQGAELLPFSPLADAPPDPSADTCWLPGGYPELHAGRIAAAERFLAGLRAFPGAIHGECGGYMVLGEALIDASGKGHAMAGLLGLVTSYEKRRLHLGYRLAELAAPLPGHAAGTRCGGFAAGTRLRGHEFHYSTIITQPDPPLARVTDAEGAEVAETGSRRGRVSGTFFHLIGAAT